MKKTLSALSVALLAVCGYTQTTDAAQTTAATGNPDSDNMIVIEQGYEAVAPVVMPQAPTQNPSGAAIQNAPTAPSPSSMQNTPEDGDVVITEEELSED